jgi:hypothetical protein
VTEYVYRLSADAIMISLAALTADEAGDDAARLLANGAESVEIERVPRPSIDDLEDAWNIRRMFLPQAAPTDSRAGRPVSDGSDEVGVA